jgi:hypothetical protein
MGVTRPDALARPGRGGHLVLNYRPTQPTGWPETFGQSFSQTIGGHVAFTDFTYQEKPYRLSVLGSGDSYDPVYEDVPRDTTLNFQKTLDSAFGTYYSFRYLGGFRGQGEFNVQSYSVCLDEPTKNRPEIRFGAGLYVVYKPDVRRGDPPVHDTLQWIQVVTLQTGEMNPPPMVDNLWRPNPYYVYGGLTSIHGTRVLNFHDIPQLGIQRRAGPGELNARFLAEVFLAQDTETKDMAGKTVVNILGGMTWGWQVRER